MANMNSERLRNIVLLSHSGAGKTMLSEAMLHVAGVTTRLGSVEEGTTTSDYEPEEQRRNTSIQTSVMPYQWKEHKVNVIDTPGYSDYRGEVISGMRVADGAVIVVAASSGIEVGTQEMWKMAESRKLPRIIFVNKADRENADFQRVLDSLVEKFGRRCVAIQVPIGSEASFSGVVNLLDKDADVPAELQSQVEGARGRLIEAVAETDDDLATKYLEGESLTSEEITRGLKQGMVSGAFVPVLVGVATTNIGVAELMNTILDLMPSPMEAPSVIATRSPGDEVQLVSDGNGPMAALVFKTTADPFVGKLSYLRVYSGTFRSDTQVWNVSKSESERVGQVFVVRGKTQEPVAQLEVGDIGAVSKLSTVLTGDTLCDRDNAVTMAGLEFPAPVYQMAVYPKAKADLDKITGALARIAEEDPTLNVTRERNTSEILFGGQGDTHIAVSVDKMKRKFGVEVQLETPKVPYMETISSATRVEYRHKKQSGGHGQFGHVWLEVEPLERDAGFEFNQKVVGGSVPKEYIPAVEKGVKKAMVGGVLARCPVVDLKVTLVDGSYHPVDSSGISFEIAGNHALSKGIMEAGPILLEPIMLAQITVPESDTGDVMGDLNSKRARILGMLPQGDGLTMVEAHVPQAEMLHYATELRSQTQGRGFFAIRFDHYDEVPAHLVQRIVETKQQSETRA